MKYRLVLFLIGLMVCPFGHTLWAQGGKWEKEISYFQEIDRREGVKTGAILFIGSSTFTMWKDLQNYFPQHTLVNRAFGGSKLREVLEVYEKVVKPYAPKQIVLYEGDNDLSWVEYSVDEFMKDVYCFVRLSQINFPEARIAIVSIKPSPSKSPRVLAKFKEANARLKEFCIQNRLDFINTEVAMYTPDGEIDKSIFLDDMLHMNAKGYERWAKIIAPYLIDQKPGAVATAKPSKR